MTRDRSRHRYVLGIAVLAVCLAAGVASSAPPQDKGKAAKPHAPPGSEKQFAVPTPPFTPGIFPCSECHKEMKPNPTRRELKEEHTNIVLNHAQGQRWCLDCHDISNRDKLRLVRGQRPDDARRRSLERPIQRLAERATGAGRQVGGQVRVHQRRVRPARLRLTNDGVRGDPAPLHRHIGSQGHGRQRHRQVQRRQRHHRLGKGQHDRRIRLDFTARQRESHGRLCRWRNPKCRRCRRRDRRYRRGSAGLRVRSHRRRPTTARDQRKAQR